MASRFALHLRVGASAAARSARGRHLPAGRSCAPVMAPTAGALVDAGAFAERIPSVQGVRHYGTRSSPSITELKRTIRKVERRLDALEGKGDIGHNPLVREVLMMYGLHETEKRFHRLANGAMAVGFGITFSVVAYYRFPWMALFGTAVRENDSQISCTDIEIPLI